MAGIHGKDAAFFVNDSGNTERNISTACNDASLSQLGEILDATTFGASVKEKTAGLKDANGSIGGNWDATTDGYLSGVVNLARAFKYQPNGAGTGKIQFSGTLIITNYDVQASAEGLITWTASYEVTGAVTRTVL